MPRFELETYLPVCPTDLISFTFNMAGVNYELGPLLKMSAPDMWESKALNLWPTNQDLFSSNILLLNTIPIDRHTFFFHSIDSFRFNEQSKSILNKSWSHERKIEHKGSGSVIKDTIIFKSRLSVLGFLFTPIYKAVLKHRHNRLKTKYS